MKETLKFLKLGLIGAISVAAISTLTVSCTINKETINNNQDVQKPGTGSTDNSSGNNGSQNPDQGGESVKPEDLLVEQQLSKAVAGFDVTKKEGIDFTNVLATSINKDNFLEYFVETIGSGFEKENGFTYTLDTVKPKVDDSTQLEVVYVISYGGKTQQKPFTFNKFKPLLPNPGGSTIQQLTYAKENFSITAKEFDRSNFRVNEITNENIEKYFSLDGKVEGLDYRLSRIETIGDEQIIIYYKIEASGKIMETNPFIFGGFKGLNLIDYNPSIALDLSQLNKIAFDVQQYSEEEKNKYIQDGGWELNLNEAYEATNTNKYIMISGKKYYVWKLKFTTQKPISTISNGNLPFTQKGQKWHDDNGGFSMAFEEGTGPKQK